MNCSDNHDEPHVKQLRSDLDRAQPEIPVNTTASGQTHWYAVNTHPRSEERARTNLERQGWRCYSPLISKTSRSGQKLITRLLPLFPSYIFVELDLDRHGWRSVDNTFGVRRIVKHDGRPAALPRACIETLLSMTDKQGVFSFSQHLSPGDSVQFLSGPFVGIAGTLEKVDAHGRITILLTLLGQATRVRATAGDIAPVSSIVA